MKLTSEIRSWNNDNVVSIVDRSHLMYDVSIIHVTFKNGYILSIMTFKDSGLFNLGLIDKAKEITEDFFW